MERLFKMAIGTAAALIGSAVVGGIASSSAASKASKAQTGAASSDLALQQKIFDTNTSNLAPFRDAGENALGALLFELGLGPAPQFGGTIQDVNEFTEITTNPNRPSGGRVSRSRGEVQLGGDTNAFNPQTNVTKFSVGDEVFDSRQEAQAFADANPVGATTFNGIQASPAALFALEQGRDTIEAGAAARGGLNSGATLAGLENLRFGLSAQDRENQLNRLAGLVDSGQGAAGQQIVAGNTLSQGASNAFSGIGNAQAAGAIGQGNAFQNALSNISGIGGFMSGSGTGGNSFGNSNIFDGLFGGGPGLGGFT